MDKIGNIIDTFNNLITQLNTCSEEELDKIESHKYIFDLNKAVDRFDNRECIDLTELHTSGILQEANRQFFHRLNLALAIVGDKNPEGEFKVYRLLGVQKYSEVDDIGLEFGIFNKSNKERFDKFLKKSENVDKLMDKYRKGRISKFGKEIEPITLVMKE